MRIFFLYVACLFFLSCNQKQFDSREELLEYLQDDENGYIQKKTVNGVDFTLMYRPTDLIVSQMLQSKNLNEVDSLRKEYNNYLYFNLSISRDNQEILNSLAQDFNAYGELVNQLTFDMQQKIHLLNSQNDTIRIADYIYERTYGLSNSNTLLIVFPKSKYLLNSRFFTLNIEDIGLKTGNIKFRILTDPIKNQPSLSIEQ